jgi:hypothetical protein
MCPGIKDEKGERERERERRRERTAERQIISYCGDLCLELSLAEDAPSNIPAESAITPLRLSLVSV